MARTIRGLLWLLLVAGWVCPSRAAEGEPLVLAAGGASDYVICLPADPAAVEQTAAE